MMPVVQARTFDNQIERTCGRQYGLAFTVYALPPYTGNLLAGKFELGDGGRAPRPASGLGENIGRRARLPNGYALSAAAETFDHSAFFNGRALFYVEGNLPQLSRRGKQRRHLVPRCGQNRNPGNVLQHLFRNGNASLILEA